MDAIEHRAREIALNAMEEGWDGPPYDPFELGDILGIEIVARQDLDDARLVSSDGVPRIEFNPQRRPARVRFSVAHEIGHFLFDDYADRVRYRDLAQRRDDDWQLEILCNVAAAEFLMPAGAFPMRESEDLSLTHLLDHRARFGVSTEALLRRVVKLTDRPAALFAAARLAGSPQFRIDYLVGSRAWRPQTQPGDVLEASVLARCTAVGFSDEATERWSDEELHVQAVGVPPYPGDSFPRLVGLLQPQGDTTARDSTLRYLRGDAAQPRGEGPTIIAHVVNDSARNWGGRGFVLSLMDSYPDAREQYSAWASAGGNPRLGAVHLAEVGDGRWIASLVAQAGYGACSTGRPRLRLAALRAALEQLAALAQARAADVHMPLIGTGQGGMSWPKVRDLIIEELADRHISTMLYVLPDAPMPEDTPAEEQLSLS
ncbi:MAG TPA: ImmA/IrrE family metallo-endopeptidase [Solirubrobacteraceae bacterium]|nr:ImmA/IrrE family metallo-endopeptidase [Solirubrobacteraceae bacterium]